MSDHSDNAASGTDVPSDVVTIPAEKIFEHLKLINIRLVELHTKLELISGPPSGYEINFTCGVAESSDGKNILANIYLEVLSTSSDPNSKTVVEIKPTYQCVYKSDGVNHEVLRPHGNGIAAVSAMASWPFLRDLVHSLTGRMSLPAFTMPMLIRDGDTIHLADPILPAPSSA